MTSRNLTFGGETGGESGLRGPAPPRGAGARGRVGFPARGAGSRPRPCCPEGLTPHGGGCSAPGRSPAPPRSECRSAAAGPALERLAERHVSASAAATASASASCHAPRARVSPAPRPQLPACSGAARPVGSEAGRAGRGAEPAGKRACACAVGPACRDPEGVPHAGLPPHASGPRWSVSRGSTMSSLVPACAGASGCLAPGKCAAAGRRASFCGLSEQTRGRLGRGPRRLWGGGEAGGVQGEERRERRRCDGGRRCACPRSPGRAGLLGGGLCEGSDEV